MIVPLWSNESLNNRVIEFIKISAVTFLWESRYQQSSQAVLSRNSLLSFNSLHVEEPSYTVILNWLFLI